MNGSTPALCRCGVALSICAAFIITLLLSFGFKRYSLTQPEGALAASAGTTTAPSIAAASTAPTTTTTFLASPESQSAKPAPAAASAPSKHMPDNRPSSLLPAASLHPACYIHMQSTPNGEGYGGMLRRNSKAIVLAERYGCAYVCVPDHWESGGHGTGNVGDLFGCQRKVIGDPKMIVSLSSVSKLPKVKSRVVWQSSMVTRPKTQLFVGLALGMSPNPAKIKTPTVFMVERNEGPQVNTVEMSWRWLSTQYNFIRRSQQRSTKHWDGIDVWKIAIQLRRGDRPDACPLVLYYHALIQLFEAMPWITSENSRILVLSEINPQTFEFQTLRHLGNVQFVQEPNQRAHFIKDLDYMATSKILIIGGGGSFPTFAGALQEDGIILHARTKDVGLRYVPHALELNSDGWWLCDLSQRLAAFAARELHTTVEDLLSRPRNSDLLERTRKGYAEYRTWYDPNFSCEAKGLKWHKKRKKWICGAVNTTRPELGTDCHGDVSNLRLPPVV